jgi:hypothetical protein
LYFFAVVFSFLETYPFSPGRMSGVLMAMGNLMKLCF